MSVNKERVDDWVAALRSGEYKQGGGQLHSVYDNEFCCLGVLCDVFMKANPGYSWDNNYFSKDNAQLESAYPTKEVMEYFGLDGLNPLNDGNPRVLVNGESVSCAQLNDTRNYTFQKIADVIEENFLKDESN